MPENLKKGWTRVAFGDVVRLRRERSSNPVEDGFSCYVGLEHLDPGDLMIRRWGNVADGTTFTSVFRAGQVLFGKRRAYQRKVAVPDFDGVCSGDIYVLEPRNEKLLSALLPFICQTDGFFEHAVGTSAGSLSPRTNWESLAKFEFALPPLDEQRTIIEVLRTSETVLNSMLNIFNYSKRLWQSAAAKYFSESGPAYRYSKVEGVPLGSLLKYASDGPFGSDLKSKHYSGQGVRVIRLQNIQENSFDDEDKAFISEEHFDRVLFRHTVQPGDILIAGLGDSRIPPGRACIAPGYIGTSINKAHCYCLRVKEELDAKFLVSFLNSPQGLHQSMSYARGSAQLHLDLKCIKSFKTPNPPLDLQRSVVKKLEEIRSAWSSAQVRCREGLMLRRILLTRIFGGHGNV
jgi:type I restriction enzyme S subunit